jgi:antitoxin ParD1/3/4
MNSGLSNVEPAAFRQIHVGRLTAMRNRAGEIMSTGIPQDMEPFVQRMVAGRRFLSEQDVVTEGLRMLQARETLREEVAKGFASLDSGKGVQAEQVYSRAEKRIAEIERGER